MRAEAIAGPLYDGLAALGRAAGAVDAEAFAIGALIAAGVLAAIVLAAIQMARKQREKGKLWE
jgi:hypothetical protein